MKIGSGSYLERALQQLFPLELPCDREPQRVQNILSVNLGVGGGGVLNNFYMGRLRPEVQPLTLSYTTLAEKVPLSYTFHKPVLGSLVLVFMQCLINELIQP